MFSWNFLMFSSSSWYFQIFREIWSDWTMKLNDDRYIFKESGTNYENSWIQISKSIKVSRDFYQIHRQSSQNHPPFPSHHSNSLYSTNQNQSAIKKHPISLMSITLPNHMTSFWNITFFKKKIILRFWFLI